LAMRRLLQCEWSGRSKARNLLMLDLILRFASQAGLAMANDTTHANQSIGPDHSKPVNSSRERDDRLVVSANLESGGVGTRDSRVKGHAAGNASHGTPPS
jgi:hypothetical protein